MIIWYLRSIVLSAFVSVSEEDERGASFLFN